MRKYIGFFIYPVYVADPVSHQEAVGHQLCRLILSIERLPRLILQREAGRLGGGGGARVYTFTDQRLTALLPKGLRYWMSQPY